jgi:Cu-Zn family superoxide dismutase
VTFSHRVLAGENRRSLRDHFGPRVRALRAVWSIVKDCAFHARFAPGEETGEATMKIRTTFEVCFAMLLAGLIPACETGRSPPANTAAKAKASITVSAVAELYPVKRSTVHGLIRFRAVDQGVAVRGRLTGLEPGRYGFGIHERGDCSGFDGKSAGDYLGGSTKAKAEPLGHLEDLVIEHSDNGSVDRFEYKLGLSGPDSIVGKSVVVEAWPTDPKVDPKAVPFAACGVIRPE